MRSFLAIALWIGGCCTICCSAERVTAQVEIAFSPNGGATDLITRTIDAATTSIDVQAYSFTSVPIAKALVAAHTRGVQVRVILDSSQTSERYSSADFLVHAGIPVAIDAAHAIAHNKIMIIDAQRVITGSFNFTKAAESGNAENVLVLDSAIVANQYALNWAEHLRHSVAYSGK